ncbi:MAG: glutathione S-transferase family protein [Pseudomonadota bacterium]
MADEPTLTFWGAGTMRSFRPIWTAEELGLPYVHKPIGPRTGETKTAEYTRLNPKQKIPCMVDGAMTLSESVAISRYLIERYGADETISPPRGFEACAREDEWVCYIYGELDETSLYVMRRHRDLHGIYGEAPAAVRSSKDYAERHLALIADRLDGRAFLLGDRLGLADILLTSCLDWAVAYEFELPRALSRYRDAITQRPAYQAAYATNYARRG